MEYAEKTTVSIAKTKADIETMIQKAGAKQFFTGTKDNIAVIGFVLADRQIRIYIHLPDCNDERFWYTPQRRKRTKDQATAAWQQACRSRWRALFLVIKAKLEAVKSGISTVEREFFYDIVLPNGESVGQWLEPQIDVAYQEGVMPPLLPGY